MREPKADKTNKELRRTNGKYCGRERMQDPDKNNVKFREGQEICVPPETDTSLPQILPGSGMRGN
jgi:hypothetical protein